MLEITASEITRASTTHVKREKICSALVELVMLVVLQHRGNTQHDTTTADCTCKHNSCDDTVVFIFFSALDLLTLCPSALFVLKFCIKQVD